MAEHDTEILILGAGIAGCIAALALAPFYTVLVVDKETQPQAKAGECLAPAAGRILHKLGLSEVLEQGHLVSHGLLSYWGTEQPTIVDSLRNPDGHGWHLDRALFEQQLREAVQRRGIACLWPAAFCSTEKVAGGWISELVHQDEKVRVRSQLVLDATGRQSRFARRLGVNRQHLDQQLSVWLTALVRVRKQISVLSSTAEGWWYSAPLPTLPDSHHSLLEQAEASVQARIFALQLQPEQLNKALLQDSSEFLQAAVKAPGLGTLVQQIVVGSEKIHGLVAANSSKLQQVAGDGWFAVGDAALSFDPLSSQGLFNAMATAMQLADLLLEHGLSDKGSVALYQAQLDTIWLKYVEHKNNYYALSGINTKSQAQLSAIQR